MPDPLDKSAERAQRFYREDPFRAGGQNTFAASEAEQKAPAGPPRGEGVFAAPVGDELPYHPTGFITTQEHRAGTLLVLAVIGLALSTLGVFLTILYEWRFMGPIVPAIALAATLPAAILANIDYGAITAGAMNPAGAAGTWWSRILGILGTLISAGFYAWLIGGDFVRGLFVR